MAKGSSKAAGGSSSGGKYTSPEDFERKLMSGKGFDDPDYAKFEQAYSEGRKYNEGLEKNTKRSINEDGYEGAMESLDTEEKMAKNDLAKLPKNKTAAQIGEEMALKEELDLINELRKYKRQKVKDTEIADYKKGII